MNRHLMETQNLVISFDYSWFLAKNLAYAECPIMKFHYRNSSIVSSLCAYKKHFGSRDSKVRLCFELLKKLLRQIQTFKEKICLLFMPKFMERSPTLPRGSDGPSSISLWCSLNLRQGDTFTLFKNKSLWLLSMNSLQNCKGLNEKLQVTLNKNDVFFHPSRQTLPIDRQLKRSLFNKLLNRIRIYEKLPKSTGAEGNIFKINGCRHYA